MCHLLALLVINAKTLENFEKMGLSVLIAGWTGLGPSRR
jgi:hypothetical protein